MSSKTVRVLYRLLQRQARNLEKQGIDTLDVRMPVDKGIWLTQTNTNGWAAPRDVFHLQSLQALAPWAAEGITSGSLSPADLRRLIARSFRQPPAGSTREEQLDRGFQSLRLLADQIAMQECSSSCATEGVHVEVTPAYVGRQSDMDPTYEEEEGVAERRYYTYRVRISNCGEETVKLLGRHWIIQDPQGQTVTEVPKGSSGVVGCTPLLKPGDCFEYCSGTDMECGSGSMQGSFQVAVVDPRQPHNDASWQRTFDARIAPFLLVLPPRYPPGTPRVPVSDA